MASRLFLPMILRRAAVACAVIGGACHECRSAPPEATLLTGRTMGTTYRVKYWGAGAATIQEVRTALDALLARFDAQMSTYRDDSELSRFNRAPAGQWFAVSPDTARVTAAALKYHRLTDGILDVTVGPILRLWRFGPGGAEPDADLRPPGDDELLVARKLVGAQRLAVRSDPPALCKQLDGVEVELSSIAPGYAVDLVVELLGDLGFPNAMVEIGGEVRASGTRPDGSDWRIGVENPTPDSPELARVVSLRNLALSTAGDYRIYRIADGRRYSHIVDPRTGQPLPFRGASATVIAPTCLEADALDTPLLVMGPDDGYKWCVEHQVAALFQTPGPNGDIQQRTTPRFEGLAGRE